jgi:hypothetical protein
MADAKSWPMFVSVVLASPVPWSFNTKGKSRDTWNGFRDEREEIFGYNKKPSFGLLSFDTAISDPTVTFGIISIDNEPIHSLTLKHSEISHKK